MTGDEYWERVGMQAVVAEAALLAAVDSIERLPASGDGRESYMAAVFQLADEFAQWMSVRTFIVMST